MDIKWIEDYLALVEHGSFTKAAEKRYVTQPAFSRRIKSLENWLGVELVDRSVYPTTLSAVGEEFVEPLQDCLRQLYSLRSAIRVRAKADNLISLSTQHSLSTAFFPAWFNQLQASDQRSGVRLNASNYHDCIDYFLAGHSDFLLCYRAADIGTELDSDHIVSVQVGTETLIPVATAALADQLTQQPCLPHISFPAESFFGRLLTQHIYPKLEASQALETVGETALSEAMKAMALQGMGVVWLPQSLIATELQQAILRRIDTLPGMTLEVRLYRFSSALSPLAEGFWDLASA